MDFNFGEIIEPSSRAFFDDYEDTSMNLEFKRPTWKWSSENEKENYPEKVKSFVIVEGVNALNIVNKSILKNQSPLARLDGHKVEIFQKDDTTICVVEEKDLNYFATITELLTPWITKADTCLAVSLQSASEYKTDDIPDSCIVRSINGTITDVPSLETPNFITGAAAGVCTIRKMKALPFECYIVYVDLYDVVAIRTILNVLKRLNLPVDDSVTLKPLHHKSDLYM